MGKTANKQIICEVLMEAAKEDKDIVALCSDSRGSGSFTPFADTYPEQFVETGIAEQNLVSIAAGLAKCGKKSYAVSPACFLSTRSYEQCKVDVAYSNTNVKLIGISGGVSYGALGMSHHSAQDIAAMSAIPNMRVYIPVEEHAPFGGLGSMVAQVTGRECPKKVVNMSLPDAPVITGTSKEVFDYYGLNAEGIANKAKEILK